ncbi:type II toxin-antitoxin system RelE/ParE family toxin [Hydrocarboniphaga sp.]|uniref:type II toxin-antitoxin system RelE/ParE family toxin n=1 Tax=Hydrocarboniphaga sp. TaxID=2033016 RepID=UPI003D0E37EA
MQPYRLSAAARADIVDILAWSLEQFGESASRRYEALLVAALQDVATEPAGAGSRKRPELGKGVRAWHLLSSRDHVTMDQVRQPRHFLIYRVEPGLIVIGRVLHETMDLARHLDPASWE